MKKFIFGFLSCLTLVSCGGAIIAFDYPYYSMQAVSYAGKLLAVNPANDADLSVCAPTATDKAPCMVMKNTDFYKMQGDFNYCQQTIVTCTCP